MDLHAVRTDPLINTFIQRGNEALATIGYTDHGVKHVVLVSTRAQDVLLQLGYPEREAELAGIAGYMHDIGNVINRIGHSQSGALLAYEILKRLNFPADEIAIICSAIGNHDEENGNPVNTVAAALILADKSHVHRKRVRNTDIATFDIHDRVNYAVESALISVNNEKKNIGLNIIIDINICPVLEYFEIFLSRMLMCRQAALFLGCDFSLYINDAKLL